MSTRPVISYDDITLPYSQPEETEHSRPSARPPPSKKRKWNNNKSNNSRKGKNASSYSVGTTSSVVSSVVQDSEMGNGEEYEEEEEESRELTHEEIWDDSALIQAWDAATEEYETYHGMNNKDWKANPPKKSPLWYNIPVEPTSRPIELPPKPISLDIQTKDAGEAEESDSIPLNFDTFVPTHDPSLQNGASHDALPPTMAFNPDYATLPAQGTMVGQDEAFSRATSAMYWAGYWTAMYHCQRSMAPKKPGSSTVLEQTLDAEGEVQEEEEEEEGEEMVEEGFVSTQR